jgi:hypothetical protein
MFRRRRLYFVSFASTRTFNAGFSHRVIERTRPVRTAEDIEGLALDIEAQNPGHRDVVILFWRPLER